MTNIAGVAGEDIKAGDLVKVEINGEQGTWVFRLAAKDIATLKQEKSE